MPTHTPCSFMPIMPTQPSTVKATKAGASRGAARSTATCSVAVACMSHVWPNMAWPPAARAPGTRNAVQSIAASGVAVGCGGIGAPTAYTVSTKSVKPFTTSASAGVRPAASANASSSLARSGA